MTAESITPSPARPTALLVGAAITALQGTALAGWGLYDIVAGFLWDAPAQGRSELGGVILLLMGALPILAGRALLKARRWGRSPAVLTNSICLPVAYYMWQNGGAMQAAGVAVGLLGLVGIGSLLTPKVTEALYGTTAD
ncbi:MULTISPECIES: hypothetical protein [unclassified Kitasatospora]|uniref:hypothetical protein n=1 Tax=unclassified Kitasatospora TaxID=2633591 RepID=UPI000710AE79|nr:MULTISPECIES: hypothetical protein [unclassified Kitasatospora]KQV23782.1 hypothetical protein ASC99_00680 [Kitasatospora sp. Root107]KRB67505.1 hypothetical protein ASE03_04055 [Kitasatospora sp. Root187]